MGHVSGSKGPKIAEDGAVRAEFPFFSSWGLKMGFGGSVLLKFPPFYIGTMDSVWEDWGRLRESPPRGPWTESNEAFVVRIFFGAKALVFALFPSWIRSPRSMEMPKNPILRELSFSMREIAMTYGWCMSFFSFFWGGEMG